MVQSQAYLPYCLASETVPEMPLKILPEVKFPTFPLGIENSAWKKPPLIAVLPEMKGGVEQAYGSSPSYFGGSVGFHMIHLNTNTFPPCDCK